MAVLHRLPADGQRHALPALAVLLVQGGNAVCAYFRGRCSALGGEGTAKALRDALYRRLVRAPYAWHKASSTGDLVQRCTSDVEVIRTFVCNQLMEVLRTVFLIVLYTGIMLSMNWRLALVPLAFIPVAGLSSGVFYGKISTRFKAADEAEGELTTCTQENLTGVRVVRAFGREKFEIDRFGEKNDHFSALWVELGRLLSVYWASGAFLTAAQVMAVIVAGTVEAVNGGLSLGDFQAFVIYNSAMAWPVRSLGRVLSDMSKAGVSLDRVGYILQAGEEKDGPQAKAARLSGDIVFDHVTFGYEGQEVLRDVSFTIPWGSTFAILGGTGSGKSTLVHLLDRLYDLEEGQGKITVGGTDIRDISREELRRQIGLVLQEPFLFSQTIRENIAATRPDAAEEELRACAQTACVDEAITIPVGGRRMIPTGLAIALPGPEWVAYIFARSGLGIKNGITLPNCVGVIDSDYRGEIVVGLLNSSKEDYTIEPGERVAQLVIMPVTQARVSVVEELDETARGAGGFGSTGKA